MGSRIRFLFSFSIKQLIGGCNCISFKRLSIVVAHKWMYKIELNNNINTLTNLYTLHLSNNNNTKENMKKKKKRNFVNQFTIRTHFKWAHVLIMCVCVVECGAGPLLGPLYQMYISTVKAFDSVLFLFNFFFFRFCFWSVNYGSFQTETNLIQCKIESHFSILPKHIYAHDDDDFQTLPPV